jgi:serine protease AprX
MVKSDKRGRFGTFVCFSIVFILAFSAIANPVLAPEEVNYEVIASNLKRVLEDAEPTDEIDIIVQMREPIDDLMLSFFNALGFNTLQRFSAINGVRLIGTKDSIYSLSKYHDVKWMEHDIAIQYYQEQSTTTINATRVWENVVLSPDGTNLGKIDGSGVTVAVVDTGIDATHPDLDYKEKTIMNLKSDFGLYEDGIWQDMPNTDNGYGHGTHCAGTIAGNGDASAGARRGVAPGANLICL